MPLCNSPPQGDGNLYFVSLSISSRSMQLTPARGRKFQYKSICNHVWSIMQLTPVRGRKPFEISLFSSFSCMQLTPVRGRKLPKCLSHLFHLLEYATHPRKGTETFSIACIRAISVYATHPRKGTETFIIAPL